MYVQYVDFDHCNRLEVKRGVKEWRLHVHYSTFCFASPPWGFHSHFSENIVPVLLINDCRGEIFQWRQNRQLGYWCSKLIGLIFDGQSRIHKEGVDHRCRTVDGSQCSLNCTVHPALSFYSSERWHQHKMCLFLSSPQAVIVKLSGYKSDLFNINLGVHSLLAGRRVLVATSPTNAKEDETTTQGRDSMRQK